MDVEAPRIVERAHGAHVVSTDRSRLDFDLVHRALNQDAYWAIGRSRATIERSFANTLLVGGAYTQDGSTVGFARMVTDLATFGWLCDVWVEPEARGTGLGVVLVETLVEHPDVATIKRQMLATADAHELYSRFGYEPMVDADRWMTRSGPDA
ncbi:MAG: GNAT family N-acetyltransferase [Actinomycetota bacterium]